MILLKNKRAWKKWAKAFNASQPQSPCQSEPKQYPCFVYTVVQSFGYEEEREIYLTGKDLTRMSAQLVQAKFTDEFTIKETSSCRGPKSKPSPSTFSKVFFEGNWWHVCGDDCKNCRKFLNKVIRSKKPYKVR